MTDNRFLSKYLLFSGRFLTKWIVIDWMEAMLAEYENFTGEKIVI